MKILVAHDGSDKSASALAEAVKLAEKFSASLKILNVVPDLCLSSEEIGPSACDAVSGSLRKDAHGSMKAVREALAAQGIEAEIIIREGRPVDQVLDAADELGVDLIVIGSHGKHGAKRYLLGSVSTKIAEYSTRNVLIVK